VTAGNALVALNIAEPTGSAGHALSVADGQGAYTQASQTQNNIGGANTNYLTPSIDFLLNANSGTHTVVGTQTCGTFSAAGFMIVCEISGLAPSPLDVTAIGATGQSTAPAPGTSGTLAQAIEIAFAVFVTRNSTVQAITRPSGYTNILSEITPNSTNNDNIQGSVDYRIVSATTALNPTYGISNSSYWAACQATFKAVVGANQQLPLLNAKLAAAAAPLAWVIRRRQKLALERRREWLRTESGLIVPDQRIVK
jgi:hypothetical protein